MENFFRPPLEFGQELTVYTVGNRVQKQTQNAAPNKGVLTVPGTGATATRHQPRLQTVEISPSGRARRRPQGSPGAEERIQRLRQVARTRLRTRLGGSQTVVKRRRYSRYVPSLFYKTRRAFSNLRYSHLRRNY